jgi:hypothetical protein
VLLRADCCKFEIKVVLRLSYDLKKNLVIQFDSWQLQLSVYVLMFLLLLNLICSRNKFHKSQKTGSFINSTICKFQESSVEIFSYNTLRSESRCALIKAVGCDVHEPLYSPEAV